MIESLDAEAVISAVTASSPVEPPSVAVPMPPINPPAAMLGDYELHREIGRGGMGIVYEATQLSLRRSVAVKTLPFAAVLDQQQVARFRNEAQAAASLHHPHIVPVYAVGCERGVHYYSMQLIDGDTLEQTLAGLRANQGEQQRAAKLSELRREEAERSAAELTAEMHLGDTGDRNGNVVDIHPGRRLAGETTSRVVKDHGSTVRSVHDRQGIRSIVQLFIHVAEALDYAHEQGVVHRDIKPSNLLMDGSGKIWVTDFGLARCRGIGNLTAEGSILGTARYMSPEQIAGRAQAVDHRTDIYSLGITLYEMLTLRPAFSAASREQLMRAVESEQPASPRRINATIETDLETIVLKAIAKSKDERYATAGDLAEDLRRYLRGTPTIARRPGKIDLAFRWAIRHRQTVMLTLLLFVMAFVGLAAATMLIYDARRETEQKIEIAKLHFNSAFRFIDHIDGLAIEELPKLPGGERLLERILSQSSKFAMDFLPYADDNPLFAVEAAKAHFLLGTIEAKQGSKKHAEHHFRQAVLFYAELAASQPSDSEIASDHAACLHQLATLYKQLGRYQEAKAVYIEATDQQQSSVESSNHNRLLVSLWATTQTNLAQLQGEIGEQPAAIDRMVSVESILAQYVQDAPHDCDLHAALIECRNALAGLVLDSHPVIAEQLFRKNIAAVDAASLVTPPHHQWSLASSAATTGEFGKLSPACQRAVAQNNLADLLAKKHELTEAIELTLSSVDVFQQCLLANPRNRLVQQHLAIAQNNLGQRVFSRAAEGDARSAEIEFEKAQQTLRELIEVEGDAPFLLSRLAGVLYNISVIKQQRGELDLALEHLTDATQLQDLAFEQAPLNDRFGKLSRLYKDSRAGLLRKISPSANSTTHGKQVTARRTGLDVQS